MDEELILELLRYNLNRAGARPDDEYLRTLIRAAILDLKRFGIKFPGPDHSGIDIEDFQTLVEGTAAWMYAKRRTGEAMPKYVRSLRTSILLAQKGQVQNA